MLSWFEVFGIHIIFESLFNFHWDFNWNCFETTDHMGRTDIFYGGKYHVHRLEDIEYIPSYIKVFFSSPQQSFIIFSIAHY